MSCIFGPVPSRRLGRSLGVDIVPFKTCSYDCIYCQLGRTTCKTIEQKEWVLLEEVLRELRARLSSRPDYITLSGSGEPTLFSRTEELIARIKAMTDIPVAVLTNGSLLWKEDVRKQLLNADLVIPSLDAGDEAMFRAVNRPHPDIPFEKMLNGLIHFRREFQGQFWLEIFLLAGYTDSESEVDKLAKGVELIRPNRVQLNTVTRPPAEEIAVNVSPARMTELAKRFNPAAEVIADFCNTHQRVEFSANREKILDMLYRRPCTITDIANGLGLHRNEILKYIEELMARNRVAESSVGGNLYYSVHRDLLNDKKR